MHELHCHAIVHSNGTNELNTVLFVVVKSRLNQPSSVSQDLPVLLFTSVLVHILSVISVPAFPACRFARGGLLCFDIERLQFADENEIWLYTDVYSWRMSGVQESKQHALTAISPPT